MSRSAVALCLLGALVGSCGDTPSASTAPPGSTSTSAPVAAGVSWSAVVPESALVGHGDVPGADHLLVGGAVAHEGTVHAYVVGFGAGEPQLVHLSWEDGSGEVARSPVDLGALDEALDGALAVPTGITVDDGRWTMVGSTAPPSAAVDPVFWQATGPGPDGPWTPDPGIVLEVGGPGTWDASWIDFPSLVETGQEHLMLYQGAPATDRNASRLGVAGSADGRSWEHPPEPALTPDECPEVRSLAIPRVLDLDDGFLVGHLAYPVGGDDAPIVLAETTDLDELGCGHPVLASADLPDGAGIHTFAMFQSAGGPALLVESLIEGVAASELWVVPLER